MNPEYKEIDIQQGLQSDESEDSSVRRVRLLRAGIRNKDQVTLDAVRDDLIKSFGESLVPLVYDKLLFAIISDVNAENIKEQYGIDIKSLQ